MAAAFWIIIFAIFVGLTGGVNEKCRSFPYFVCAIGIVFSALQFANVCFINARPDSKTIQKGMVGWQLLTNDDLTFPSYKPSIKIDYLFGYPNSGWQVVRTQSVQSLLSDHLPIITELEFIREIK